MKKGYLKYVNYTLIIISIIPLFFYNPIYPSIIYNLLFGYFVIEMIRTRKVYINKKNLFLLDSLATISLLMPVHYKFLTILRITKFSGLITKQKGYKLIAKIIKENKELFKATIYIMFTYVIISSLIVFQIEPETFHNNYFDAFYWAVISLSTVGYGDIYPVTTLGKTFAMISALFGIGLIALPTGIVSSKFIKAFNDDKKG